MNPTASRKRRLSPSANSNSNENEDESNQPPSKRVRLDSNSNGESKEEKSASNPTTHIWNGRAPESHSVKELKTLCRSHSLEVGGNKSQLIVRLKEGTSSDGSHATANASKKKKRTFVKHVHAMRSKVDIENPEGVNKCIKEKKNSKIPENKHETGKTEKKQRLIDEFGVCHLMPWEMTDSLLEQLEQEELEFERSTMNEENPFNGRLTGEGNPVDGDSERCPECGQWQDYAGDDVYLCMTCLI